MKKTIAIIATLAALCFAQEVPQEVEKFPEKVPEKLAVYAYGANEAGVNKSLGGKLLATLSQSGEYAEIADPGAFQEELAKGKQVGMAQIVQAAKRHGADFVCVVSITEVFGAHSISARILKTSDSQIIKIGTADRPLKSLEDLTAVSNELARQLLPPSAAPPAAVAAPAAAVVPAPVAAPPMAGSADLAAPAAAVAVPMPLVIDRVAAAQNECARKYNINELLFKLKDGFPTQLKDCSSKLAKDMLTPASLGGKKLGEPVSFMKQCSVDGIKKEIPEGFPNVDKVIGSVDNFVQTILNSASAGGGLDPKKLVSSVGSISTSINTLLDDVKSLSSSKCIVNEPYEPPVAQAGSPHSQDDGEDKDKDEESVVSFGFRVGLNFSHIYAEYSYGRGGSYSDIGGMQAGIVLDIAASKVFHIQPGIMYIQKGLREKYGGGIEAHYLEFPVLLSLKFSVLRLNAGPYFGACLSTNNDNIFSPDFGISTGLGFDIGMFYIGALYDYGLSDMSSVPNSYFYNRTLGFNVGLNF